MGQITYFVCLPFVRNDEGELCPIEAIECRSAQTAVAAAEQIAQAKAAGAIAFWRTGDTDAGAFDDAVILTSVGAVPDDLEMVSGA